MMKTAVITGSTRGIGLGLAQQFLSRGCQVVVSGRSEASVRRAVETLSASYPAEYIHGQACDVSQLADVQKLWDSAVSRFGRVDIWINNAAINTPEQLPAWEQPQDAITSVIETNLLGVIYGCKVAISGMIAQGGGHVYNMEGSGSGGEVMIGNAMYGTTKAGLRYLTKALVVETKGHPVKVSYLSPGIVTTDLLMQTVPAGKEAETERIFNILADDVETVTAWLVERILANDKSGARIVWLTPSKIMRRFMLAPLRKRDVGTRMMRAASSAHSNL